MKSRWLFKVTILGVVLVVVGCSEEHEPESAAMQSGFSWVIDEKLAGMPRPGAVESLDDDLAFLEEHGIDLLVSLTVQPLDSELLARHQISSLHLPVEDFHPPTQEQLTEFVERTQATLDNGGSVGVHCTAGMGRSGTFLATYLVYLGSTPDEAIAKTRELRPGSIETSAQEEAIKQFYAHLHR